MPPVRRIVSSTFRTRPLFSMKKFLVVLALLVVAAGGFLGVRHWRNRVPKFRKPAP